MNCKEFLKPTLFKVILFIVLMIVFYLFFASVDVRIFHCTMKYGVPENFLTKEGFCGLALLSGVQNIFSPLGYLTMFIVLIIIPYLISCAVALLRKK